LVIYPLSTLVQKILSECCKNLLSTDIIKKMSEYRKIKIRHYSSICILQTKFERIKSSQ
jgi:hypothetical protein